MGAILERLRQIPPRMLEWWKKFNTRQKILLSSSVAVVVVALVILGVVLAKPNMVILKECANTGEAAEVKQLLDDNDYTYEMSDNGLIFYVRKEDNASATLLLGSNNITAYGYEWSNLNRVFEGGFSTTEADTAKRYQLYMENDLEDKLRSMAEIDDAHVILNVPPQDGTLISRGEESYAWVILTLNKELDASQAAGLGRAIATAIGNSTTNNITIMDSNERTLFAGGENDSSISSANSNLEIRAQVQNDVAERVRSALMVTNLYNTVSVVPNLDMDFTEMEVLDETIYPAEGQEDQGLVSQENIYSASGTGNIAGVPGTDSNDNNSYVFEDGSYSNYKVNNEERTYQNSKRTTSSKTTMGAYNYDTSTLAVVASTYRVYNEVAMRESGQLDGTTFDEFKAANDEKVQLDVDPALVTSVSMATGIPEENISIVAYEIHMFEYASDEEQNFMDYLPIILAALIMIMLGYVVFRSTRREPEPEMVTELSVEDLLESTREAQEEALEDIGFSEKSETRILIEKFVDENPEAVASLLRNWLNEEWE